MLSSQGETDSMTDYLKQDQLKGQRKNRKSRLKNNYNLTLEDYEAMLEDQNYSCWICQTSIREHSKAFVDHCHETKVVRGLLCIKCNTGLGMFKDNVRLLAQAIVYLQRT